MCDGGIAHSPDDERNRRDELPAALFKLAGKCWYYAGNQNNPRNRRARCASRLAKAIESAAWRVAR